MFDSIVKRITDILKLGAIAAPIALSVASYIYRDVIIKAVANEMYPTIYQGLEKDLPLIISDVLLNDEKTSVKLDSSQMLQIQSYVVESQEQTLRALPVMIMKYADVAESKILTRTYPIYDFLSGRYLYDVTGVKTDTSWIILQNEPK